jgi:MoxR-like ATPase
MTASTTSSEPATRRVALMVERVLQSVATRIVGQDEALRLMLTGILCHGHCMLEGVPGVAKTLMVKSLAEALGLSFGRIQFTPDLMPADITGMDVLEENPADGSRQTRFLPGPLFTELLLADEINRSPPKTQAALLEAMQEGHVTVGGQQHSLPSPFVTLATQNPIEQEGTYPLPEGQRDRFLMQIVVGYPARHEELEVVKRTTGAYLSAIAPVTGRDELQAAHEIVRAVPIAEHVLAACVDLARCSRPGDPLAPPWLPGMVRWGAGPRASQALALVAKATAAMAGRPAAELSDVRHLASAVLRHRLVLTFEAESDGVSADMIIERLIETRLS